MQSEKVWYFGFLAVSPEDLLQNGWGKVWLSHKQVEKECVQSLRRTQRRTCMSVSCMCPWVIGHRGITHAHTHTHRALASAKVFLHKVLPFGGIHQTPHWVVEEGGVAKDLLLLVAHRHRQVSLLSDGRSTDNNTWTQWLLEVRTKITMWKSKYLNKERWCIWRLNEDGNVYEGVITKMKTE